MNAQQQLRIKINNASTFRNEIRKTKLIPDPCWEIEKTRQIVSKSQEFIKFFVTFVMQNIMDVVTEKKSILQPLFVNKTTFNNFFS